MVCVVFLLIFRLLDIIFLLIYYISRYDSKKEKNSDSGCWSGGSGITTVSKMCNHFKLKHIYAGDLFRAAKEVFYKHFEEFLQDISKEEIILIMK